MKTKKKAFVFVFTQEIYVHFCSDQEKTVLLPQCGTKYSKKKNKICSLTGAVLSALQSDAVIAQHPHNNSIFMSIANKKHTCVSFQGQGIHPRWLVVKIDTEHKLSTPLKDLEAPMCRLAFAFELSLLHKENSLNLFHVLSYKRVHVIFIYLLIFHQSLIMVT